MLRYNDVIKPHILIVYGKACGFYFRYNNGVGVSSFGCVIDLEDIPGARNDGQLRPNLVVIVSRCTRTVPGVCCYIIPKIDHPDKRAASVLIRRVGIPAVQVDVCR